MKTKTLILKRKDVEKLIDIRKSIAVVEQAFRAHGRGMAQMPAKIYLDLKKYAGDFRAMPVYIEGLESCALKWVNAHPNNKKYDLPAVMAVIILNDPKTGFPLCIMDGTYTTNLRTGAVGAVAAKYLARKDSNVIGLVGCGAQAHTQMMALKQFFKIKEVKVWGHKKSLIARFIKDMKRSRLKLIPAENIKDCVEGSDIVVTTTPSRKPLVKLKWLKQGVHINAIGADAKGKQELEPAILKKSKLVIDDWAQAAHSGEINVAVQKKIILRRDVYAQLGDIVAGKRTGRVRTDEITVFDSTGLAIQDLAVANLIYKVALRKGKGTMLRLI